MRDRGVGQGVQGPQQGCEVGDLAGEMREDGELGGDGRGAGHERVGFLAGDVGEAVEEVGEGGGGAFDLVRCVFLFLLGVGDALVLVLGLVVRA